MSEIIIMKMSIKELELSYKEFNFLFAENTRGHEVEKDISESYINQKAKEIFAYLENGSAILIGAFRNNTLIGFLWAYKRDFLEERRLYINSLIIDKGFRGKRIGTLLLLELEQIALNIGITVLDVSTAAFKEDVIKFYENIGYKQERIQLCKSLK